MKTDRFARTAPKPVDLKTLTVGDIVIFEDGFHTTVVSTHYWLSTDEYDLCFEEPVKPGDTRVGLFSAKGLSYDRRKCLNIIKLVKVV